MIKKKQKNTPRESRAALLAQDDLTRVSGGDPPMTRIRETLVGD